MDDKEVRDCDPDIVFLTEKEQRSLKPGVKTKKEQRRLKAKQQSDARKKLRSEKKNGNDEDIEATEKLEAGELQSLKGGKTTEDFDTNEIECEHPDDTYSFFVVSQYGCNASFWLALSICIVQVMFFSMVLFDNLRTNDETTNDMNFPVNVSIQVRIVQAVAILITIFLQDDLRIALERWHESYTDLKNGENFPDSTRFKWYLALVLRFTISLFGLAAILLLIMQSDNVFDLTLNFTGLGFISELDNIAFLLGKDGFFGDSIEKLANQVKTGTYRAHKDAQSWCLRVTLWLLIGIGLYTCYGLVTFNQEYGNYAIDAYYVTFDDPVMPSMVTFTGTYVLAWDSRSRRPVYYSGITAGGRKKNAMFAHNGEEWVFGICDSPCIDYCTTNAHSDKFVGIAFTSTTDGRRSFDLRDTSGEPWKLGNWIEADNKWGWEVWYNPANLRQEISFQYISNLNPQEISPSRLKCQELCEKTCLEIQINEQTSSFPDVGQRKRARVYQILDGGNVNTTAYDHPIFVGRHPNATDQTVDLILVLGNRWALTDSSKLYGLNEKLKSAGLISGEISSSEKEALEKYFNDLHTDTKSWTDLSESDGNKCRSDPNLNGFHAIQLRNPDSIAYLSDEVETRFGASMYPFSALNWYPAYYPEDQDVPYDKYKDEYNWFPGVDPTTFSGIGFDCTEEYDGSKTGAK